MLQEHVSYVTVLVVHVVPALNVVLVLMDSSYRPTNVLQDVHQVSTSIQVNVHYAHLVVLLALVLLLVLHVWWVRI